MCGYVYECVCVCMRAGEIWGGKNERVSFGQTVILRSVERADIERQSNRILSRGIPRGESPASLKERVTFIFVGSVSSVEFSDRSSFFS